MSVLFIGIDNPVSIAASGIPSDKIKVVVDKDYGSVKGKDGKYLISVNSPKLKVLVYKTEGDNDIFIDTLHFKIKPVPSPVASINGYSGDCEMSKEELLKADKITDEMSDFIFDMKFPIVAYNMSVNIHGLFCDAPGKGPEITEKMKSWIQQVDSPGRVFIENVYVQAPEGLRQIKGISIKIK